MASTKQQLSKFSNSRLTIQPDKSNKLIGESITTRPLNKDAPIGKVSQYPAEQLPVKETPKQFAKEKSKEDLKPTDVKETANIGTREEMRMKNPTKVEPARAEETQKFAAKEEIKKKESDNDVNMKVPQIPSDPAFSVPIGVVKAESKAASVPPSKSNRIPVQRKSDFIPSNVAVPRQRAPLPAPVLQGRPLVLATHLVPSLPIGLFELLAEAIEVATGRPTVVVHESRDDRPVAEDIADIAILPRNGEWKDGKLLPITFVFAHHLNKNNSPGVYADIIVTADHGHNVEKILDLRGHRCALPDRRQQRGVAALLFENLRAKGESPAFFGNTLDSGSQLATLQMVAGKQAEVGILESPVIACHKNTLPGVNSLRILDSLGPLPPYPIFVSDSLPADIKEKISSYLLKLKNNEDWAERLSQFGILGFAENSPDNYIIDDSKPVVTSVPYY